MLTKLKLALLIAAPLVAGATTYAVAGDDAPARKDVIEKFDKNGDGKLDDAERAQRKAAFEARHAERRKEVLARYDANKDGTLDDAERKAMRDDKLAQRFQAMDKDGDGKLTLGEFQAGAGTKGGFHRHGRHGHGRSHGAGMKP
jgi:Ca2+-binding EF-hand superfamily protein